MKYTIRWCGHDGNEQEEALDGLDLEAAVEAAQQLDARYDGVEVLDDRGRPVWPFRLEDADL